jgi:hypothetical protein
MLYRSTSTSPSSDKRSGVLTFVAVKRGAELVRDERLGRAVRGVEVDEVGEGFVVWFERPRFDLLRWGRS